MPIGQRGPVLQVHRHRCNHGLERHTAPPRSCCYVTRLRPTPQFSPLAAHKTIACGQHITTDDVHILSCCYARHTPLKFRTTVLHPKEVPSSQCQGISVSWIIMTRAIFFAKMCILHQSWYCNCNPWLHGCVVGIVAKLVYTSSKYTRVYLFVYIYRYTYL